MLQHQLPSTLFRIICNMFDNVHIAIISQNYQSRYILLAKGVLQESILSSLLYAVFINTLPCRLSIKIHNFGHQPLYIRTTPATGKTEASVQEQQ